MDSDCLIKLAKSSVKEVVISALELYVTPSVVKETVDDVAGRNYPDAELIASNIGKRRLKLSGRRRKKTGLKAEYEILSEFESGRYDVIASDDAGFLKILRSLSLPYLTPATIIVLLKRRKFVTSGEAGKMLDKLSVYINKEQYLAARRML